MSKTIPGLKNTKICGHDNISTTIFKEISTELSTDIAEIVNKSMIRGNFPQQLKLTVLKTGKTDQYTNYRPFCILAIMSKIVEKTVNSQLQGYLEENRMIHKKQYGFRWKSDTSTATFDLVTLVQNLLDKKFKVCATFFDIKKAFETVDRNILVKKLNSYGIKGTEHKWFNSYFKDREQYIDVNKITTQHRNINVGVPQGSNLSTTLFLIFIDDIKDNEFKGEVFLYADDIAIVNSAKTYEELEEQAKTNTRSVQEWINRNHLT